MWSSINDFSWISPINLTLSSDELQRLQQQLQGYDAATAIATLEPLVALPSSEEES
ncbi:MAG: hypothetical protein VKJ64_22365 [Leptolyngbyaceae bacterium]|nr:hypothetical protein [Leptolyngbyaceae bacterium]